LELELASASLVIARSGYSTVMDLVRMRRRAVLVPTPGQTEQEYLARHLSDAGLFLSVPQSSFDLRKAIDEGLSAHVPSVDMDFDRHREVVRCFLSGQHGRKR
jgi:predicted glycosyltransferase